ncbi:cation diffusion facilitator family transporter [Trueperella bonasi]|uniref:Cation diffusion facilitator family transporter n=1 Tax=Trueperella bonasi TaxID=312286 RepID=A0ABT9NHP9_9ACTO|nr:cation diffusion facilitator family transporter [Trueperella bonasi]MDP9806926.1 cation diffusion facilitator family transporter [Trueperella bonasi]
MSNSEQTPNLTKYAWLSIAVAIITIALKAGAYFLTGSVSLLSDAMESVVNLVAAVIALIALTLAAKPASSRYTYGRTKAEYFSAAVEGAMIFGAAALIIFAAIQRLLNPAPVESLGIGILISVIAALINGAAGYYLVKVGRKHRSVTLEADGKHLLTDLVTSAGVVLGLILVILTGWQQLDPIIAILVALNIIRMGIELLRQSVAGLLDVTLPKEENKQIVEILQSHSREGAISFHGLQTRQAGRHRFINVDLQVPGSWSVKDGHDLAMIVEDEIQAALPDSTIVTHVEPIEDESSYLDIPVGYIPLELDDEVR